MYLVSSGWQVLEGRGLASPFGIVGVTCNAISPLKRDFYPPWLTARFIFFAGYFKVTFQRKYAETPIVEPGKRCLRPFSDHAPRLWPSFVRTWVSRYALATSPVSSLQVPHPVRTSGRCTLGYNLPMRLGFGFPLTVAYTYISLCVCCLGYTHHTYSCGWSRGMWR